jgi:hypothetical protein
VIRRLDRAVFESTGSLRAVAILRAMVGAIALLHLMPFLRAMKYGIYYADYFYVPYASWYPELPRTAYFVALSLCAVTAAMMTLGVLARAATIYTAAFVTYNFLLSQTHFHHNRTFLVIVLCGLALLPSMQLRGDSRGRLWPVYWLRFEHAVIYLASGFSKLIDPDWWGGAVTLKRVLWFQPQMQKRGVPEWLIDVVSDPTVHYLFAKVAIVTELFIGIALWFPRTRLMAIWVGIAFHIGIEIAASVQVFSYLCVAAMLLWVTPELGAHTAVVRTTSRGGRAMWWCLRWLDWLGRFRAETTSDPSAPVIEVDGERGSAAVFAVLVRCPALFFAACPASVVAHVLRWLRRDASDASESSG